MHFLSDELLASSWANHFAFHLVNQTTFACIGKPNNSHYNLFFTFFLFELLCVFEEQSHQFFKRLFNLFTVRHLGLHLDTSLIIIFKVLHPFAGVWDQISFVKNKDDFLIILLDNIFNVLAPAADWISGINHLDNNIG